MRTVATIALLLILGSALSQEQSIGGYKIVRSEHSTKLCEGLDYRLIDEGSLDEIHDGIIDSMFAKSRESVKEFLTTRVSPVSLI